MSGPRDLHISISAASSGQHVLNGGPKGATFPGWFLQVHNNEGYNTVIPATQLDIGQVTAITGSLDCFVDNSDRGLWRITTAAKNCDTNMRNELQRQLEVAEAHAAKIPALRRQLGLDE